MKKYTVQVNQTIRRTITYIVDADSKDEAVALVDDCAVDPVRTYEKNLDTDTDAWETK